MESSGRCNTGKQIIIIEPTQHQQAQESAIIHEIFETLNYHLELKLSHEVVMQLEAGLYQVLRDNGVDVSVLLKEIGANPKM